ncbi:MAG: GatB/YqeY domain-containing protein [Patescibacteria group bacterium]
MASMYEELESKIKDLLLGGDKTQAEVYKMLKSALLLQAKELSLEAPGDEIFVDVLRKQIKMREDAVESFIEGGAADRADKERDEAELLKSLLPKQINDDEISVLIDEVANELGLTVERSTMGKIIAGVSERAGQSASKSDIARAINKRLA